MDRKQSHSTHSSWVVQLEIKGPLVKVQTERYDVLGKLSFHFVTSK